jgi:hypothetical protein
VHDVRDGRRFERRQRASITARHRARRRRQQRGESEQHGDQKTRSERRRAGDAGMGAESRAQQGDTQSEDEQTPAVRDGVRLSRGPGFADVSPQPRPGAGGQCHQHDDGAGQHGDTGSGSEQSGPRHTAHDDRMSG